MYFYTGPGGAASESPINSDDDEETIKASPTATPTVTPKGKAKATKVGMVMVIFTGDISTMGMF